MSSHGSTGLYEFDPRGINPDNLIGAERQTLQTPQLNDYYFIIPHAAPFFLDSLEVRNDSNGTLYTEGVDYVIGHLFVDAMASVGRPVGGSIRFLNRSIAGIVRLSYRTIGGEWGYSEQVIVDELSNRQMNPVVRSWEQIAPLPATFPPLPHDQSLDTLVGSDQLLGGLEDIEAAIRAAGEGSTQQHIEDYNNPHRVTKAQVGLPLVQNYGIAPNQTAEEGISDSHYMTPLKTKLAIAVQALNPLNAHIQNKNNPHEVDAADVGLGLVSNFPIATPEQAADLSRNDLYLTPFSAAALILQNSDTGRLDSLEQLLDDHLQDTDNPHNITPSKIGTYTSEEIDAMVGNATAADTPRFDGMTGEEWRETLPSFDDITLLVTTIQQEYSTAAGQANSINVNPPVLPPLIVPEEITAGVGRYAIHLSDGTSHEQPQPAVFGNRYEASEGEVAFLTDASYRITPDGFVTYTGNSAIQSPVAYREGAGSAPAVKPRGVYPTNDRVLLMLEDGVLIEYTSVADNVLRNNIVDVAVANMDSPHILLRDSIGGVEAMGPVDFTANANAVLSGLSAVEECCVGRTEFWVLLLDGSVQGWSISPTGVVASIALGELAGLTFQSVSGQGEHFVFLTDDGAVYTRGDAAAINAVVDPIYGPFNLAVAGPNYTVTANTRGVVHYWGRSVDNSFRPPSHFGEV